MATTTYPLVLVSPGMRRRMNDATDVPALRTFICNQTRLVQDGRNPDHFDHARFALGTSLRIIAAE